jgi:hypothetical protein
VHILLFIAVFFLAMWPTCWNGGILSSLRRLLGWGGVAGEEHTDGVLIVLLVNG